MTLFHVRPATLDDLDTLVSFTLAEAQEAEGLDLVPETVRRGVRAGLEDPAVSRYWLLEGEADGPVGAISIVREWSDWQAATYWWIQSLYLEPGFRGQDLLAPLLETVGREARREGALDLRLYVHQANERAIRAYRRAGFSQLPYDIMTLAL
jgi:GNAT superfamily N-acetyltransferase